MTFSYFRKFFKKDEEQDFRDKLEEYIESDDQTAEDGGIQLDKSELALVSNVLRLRDLTAADVMIPRAEIICAKRDASLEEFIDIFSKCGFSQIPVYNNTLDDVVGVARIRDFLPFVLSPDSFEVKAILRDATFVVPSMPLLDLLVSIRASSNHMALVVDEFGGVDGLVTLNDVITEIVGEIQQSNNILNKIIVRQDGSYLVDARLLLTEFEEKIGINLLDSLVKDVDDIPDIETIGGLVSFMAGRMPTKGETLIHPKNIEIEIVEAEPRRVKRVIMRIKE